MPEAGLGESRGGIPGLLGVVEGAQPHEGADEEVQGAAGQGVDRGGILGGGAFVYSCLIFY